MKIGDTVVGLNEYVQIFKGQRFIVSNKKVMCGNKMISFPNKLAWFNEKDFKVINTHDLQLNNGRN